MLDACALLASEIQLFLVRSVNSNKCCGIESTIIGPFLSKKNKPHLVWKYLVLTLVFKSKRLKL